LNLRGVHRRGRLGDVRLGRFDLRPGLGYPALGRSHLRRGLFQRYLIIRRIQFHQQVALVNEFVVAHMQGQHLRGSPGTNLGDMPVDVSVVGGNILSKNEPQNYAPYQQENGRNASSDEHWFLVKGPRILLRFILVSLVRFFLLIFIFAFLA